MGRYTLQNKKQSIRVPFLRLKKLAGPKPEKQDSFEDLSEVRYVDLRRSGGRRVMLCLISSWLHGIHMEGLGEQQKRSVR
jgi:hypothetical protein